MKLAIGLILALASGIVAASCSWLRPATEPVQSHESPMDDHGHEDLP